MIGRKPLGPVILALLASCGFATPVAGQSGGRLLETVDASDGERHVNVVAQFRCNISYLSHTPLDLGRSVIVRLRLAPDCGADAFSTERPTISGSSQITGTAQLEPLTPGEYMLTLQWNRDLHFLLAPTISGRGVHLRLLDVFQGGRGNITVNELTDNNTGFAVNLESQTQPFDPRAVEDASTQLKMPAHVSTVELEGRVWYRLRVGPVVGRRDAERLLAAAQQLYPRAWLGIDDEIVATADDVKVPSDVRATVPLDPPIPDAQRAALLDGARTAIARRDYPRAIELLTKLTRQPEYPDRARAQELLGLTRERAGQLAHAKAEYQEYLSRYPKGDAAGRLRTRLRILASASRKGLSGTLAEDGRNGDRQWRVDGGVTQMYRWERTELTSEGESVTRQAQNALFTDTDVVARKQGVTFDAIGRLAAGYAKDLLSDGPGDQVRVSSAFFELNSRDRGIAMRVGRQSRNSGGLLGTFDGLLASYRLRPKLNFNAALGFPVESTRDGVATQRQLLGLAAEIGPFKDRWDFGVFAVAQQLDGETDRQALGFEGRYFVPGRTLIGMIDYDLHFQALNSLVLMGNLQLPARWTLSANLDHRRAPILTTRNALIGQTAGSIDELLQTFGPSEIQQFASDRAPQSDLLSVSLTRALGERYFISIDAFGYRTAASPASGGVAAVAAIDLDRTLQLQISANSLFRSSDLWVASLRHQSSELTTVESLGLAARLPIGGAWRIGPRVRIDRRTATIDLTSETLIVPTVRIDYQRGRTWFELEGGAEFGDRQLAADSEKSRRYYFGLGYRIGF